MYLSNAAYQILDIFFEYRPVLSRSVELGHSLISWGNNDGRKTALFAQGVIACIIAYAPQRNERWLSLTMHHLGITEPVLRSYLDHGDSVLLANMIHFTHQFVRNFLEVNWEEFPLSYILQRLGSSYNVQGTLPGLQHDFCSLWNEIVLQRRDIDHPLLSDILVEVHPIYVAFHQGSTLYDQVQLCSVPSHRIDSASNLNEVDDGRTTETARAPITTSPALHHHNAVPSVISPVTECHAPPSPTSNLDRAIPHLVDEQSRNGILDNITPVASSLHPAPLEKDPISDGTAADPMQGTTDFSTISSMVDTGFRSTSSHVSASRPTRNMTTGTPSFVPDTSPIPLLTVSPDPATPHISVGPIVDRSGGLPDDGSISHSSSQILTSFPLVPEVISGFDSNGATEIGLLDAPDDTLDSNCRVMSQSFTQSSADVAEYRLRPEDGDPSETSGPSP